MKLDEDAREAIKCLAVLFLCLIAFLALVVFPCSYASAYMEAEAYFSVTGKRVSAWDAMFLDLRVQGPTE